MVAKNRMTKYSGERNEINNVEWYNCFEGIFIGKEGITDRHPKDRIYI